MCRIENCLRKNKAKGLCQKHHYQLGETDVQSHSIKHGMWKSTEYNIWRFFLFQFYFGIELPLIV